MMYNWQLNDWPHFQYDTDLLEDMFHDLAERIGRVSGVLEGLPEAQQVDALIDMMVQEAIKTSEIEGEYLSRRDVMSSIRNNLGLNMQAEQVRDKRAKGAAELMVSVRNNYSDPLTEDMLFDWHSMLMQGSRRVTVGAWRDHAEAMQVVSGLIGKEVVHYEAPPSSSVPEEMKAFIAWFNNTEPGGSSEIKRPVVRSAVAHLYFETIHPFEDGNGRIGRAISEKALSQGYGRPVLLSLSKAIEANKNAYYEALKEAQRSNEITHWISYFVHMVFIAQEQAEELIDFTLQKSKFFEEHESHMNERQLRVVRRMMEKGPDGFEGGMSAKKYMRISGASKATATRDLQDLVAKEAMIPVGAGRGARYELSMRAPKGGIWE